MEKHSPTQDPACAKETPVGGLQRLRDDETWDGFDPPHQGKARPYIDSMKAWHLYLTAAVLFVIGVCLIMVRHLGPAPEVTCVEDGKPTSGFSVTIDGKDCPLSSEDFQKYWDWDKKSALPVRWAGLGVVALSLGTVIGAVVMQAKARKRRRQAPQPPMPPMRSAG